MESKWAQCEIAISYLEADEAVARSLKARLEGRWDVFLYSERQKELGGTDGLVRLSAIFKSAHLVVVLFRENWGQTKWTRVEETAVKERGFDEGWTFLVVVALGKAPDAPAWLPKTRIWLDYERYGLDAAAAVVDARAQEAGGQPKPDDAVSVAARLAAIGTRREDNEKLLESEQGVRLAEREVAALFQELSRIADQMRQHVPSIIVKQTQGRHPTCLIRAGRSELRLIWNAQFTNSLKYSELQIHEIEHSDSWPLEENESLDYSATLSLDADAQPVWSVDDDDHVRNSHRLADELLKGVVRRAFGAND